MVNGAGANYLRIVFATAVLVHSHFVGPTSWEPTANELRGLGFDVVVPDLTKLLSTSSRYSWGDIAASDISSVARKEILAVVGHSGAGAFLPMVSAGLGASKLVFVDAIVPPVDSPWRATSRLRDLLDQHLGKDGRLAPWPQWRGEQTMQDLIPDAELRRAIERECPRVVRGLYDLNCPNPMGWSALPSRCYIQLSGAYDNEFVEAKSRGWQVERIEGKHLDIASKPSMVAAAINRMIRIGDESRRGGESMAPLADASGPISPTRTTTQPARVPPIVRAHSTQ